MPASARRLRVVDPDAPPRFGVAVRVSRVMGRGGDAFHSPAVQEAAARRAVEAVGGVVDETVGDRGVFVDLDVSGAVAPSDRPGLGAALDLIRAGMLDGIAVHDLSRWSREVTSGLRELEQVAALGGQVVSAAETIDLETPGGRFTTTIHLAAAQLRRDEASKAWRATIQARWEQGRHHGVPPLGYVRGTDGLLQVDPVLGEAIRQGFAAFAAGTVSQHDLARRLAELRGVRTWPTTVRDLLASPVYLGRVELHGQYRPGLHEPLVDQATFDTVQRMLTQRAGQDRRRFSAPHSLAGLLVCDLCDRALWRRRPGAGSWADVELVMCRTKRESRTCPGIGTPRLLLIEDEVRARVRRLASKLRDDAGLIAARQSARARAEVDVGSLRAELRATERAIAKAGALLAREVYTETQYAAAVGELERAAAAVRARLAVVETAAAVPVPEQLASAADRLDQLWGRMTAQEQRAGLQVFVGQVRVRRAARPGEPVKDRLVVLDHDGQRLD